MEVETKGLPEHTLLTEMLNNIKSLKSYYIGGTLCIDLEDAEDTQVLCINLNGTIRDLVTEESRNMNDWNTDLAFKIYKEEKGETDYYLECKNKEFVRNNDG